MEKKATMPVPICATVSRKTGEIRFEYSESFEDQLRLGRIMNRIARDAEWYQDQEAKKASAGAAAGI